MEIWKHVSIGMLDGFPNGRSVYTYTQFYNHGPIRSYVLYFYALILDHYKLDDMFTFHTTIVLFMGIVDTITAALIWKFFSFRSSLIFLLNPVSILITGYHSQIEGTVISIAFLSWALFLKAIELFKNTSRKYIKFFYSSAVVLGISMGIKHVFFLYPIYLFLLYKRHKLFSFKEIVAYSAIVYSIFFGLFAVEVFRDSYHPPEITYRNIKMYVFDYRAGGLYGESGADQLLRRFIPRKIIENHFSFLPFFTDYTFFFAVGTMLFGILAINRIREYKYVFPLYLLGMFISSPSLANQYLIVPVVAMSIFHQNILSLIYFFWTYVHLASGSSANISELTNYHLQLSILGKDLPFFPWNFPVHLSSVYSQTWGLLLALTLLLQLYGFSFKSEISRLFKNYL